MLTLWHNRSFTMSKFSLHAQLAADTISVCSLEVSDLLLMNDNRYPWLIVVPREPGARELHQLPQDIRLKVLQEVQQCSTALEAMAQPYKLNVATLGNQVEQLHIHIIARYTADAAWPGAVWGVGQRAPYLQVAADKVVNTLKGLLRR